MEIKDISKLVLAALLVIAGLAGYYLIADAQSVLRVVAVVMGVLLATLSVLWSMPGKRFIGYAQDSVAEAKKVVWPAPREAMQLTALVFVFVFVLALFMWLVDSGLTWLFYDVILGRG